MSQVIQIEVKCQVKIQEWLEKKRKNLNQMNLQIQAKKQKMMERKQ